MTLANQVTKIRNALLLSTLQYAVKESLYYKRTLGDHYLKVRTVEDLWRLPIIDKQTMVANLEEILIGPQVDDFISLTSGTTGETFPVRRNRAECEEIIKVWNLVNNSNKGNNAKLPLILDVYYPSHSLPVAPPPRNVIRIPDVQHESSYRWLRKLLSNSYDFPETESRISAMTIIVPSLQTLTLYFLQENFRPSEFGVRRISTSSASLTTKWRAFLSEQWQAVIIDSYSLSEFASNGAIQCQECGYQHFVLPTLIPEIVDPLSHQPIESGVGALVLTGLHPFSQRQLFIRYWTGDVVECGPRCEHDDVGFRIKGRLDASLFLASGERARPLLLLMDVDDVLDSLSDINRPYSAKLGHTHFLSFLHPDLNRMIAPTPFHYHMQEKADGQHLVQLEVELSYLPQLFPDRVNELRHQIVSDLCARNPYLAAALDSRAVDMEVCFRSPHDPIARTF